MDEKLNVTLLIWYLQQEPENYNLPQLKQMIAYGSSPGPAYPWPLHLKPMLLSGVGGMSFLRMSVLLLMKYCVIELVLRTRQRQKT